MEFHIDRANLYGADCFKRFTMPNKAVPLKVAGLNKDDQLLVFERMGVRMALRKDQMAYHHTAQGEVKGEPYLISF